MAMATIADFLGNYCTCIPDGETGESGYWNKWEEYTFENCEDLKFEVIMQTTLGFNYTIKRRLYKIKDGVIPSSLDLGELGYADEAIKSYKTFKILKNKKIINAKVRFQVGIPSAMALVVGFIVTSDQRKVEPAVVKAIKRELKKLQSSIPPEELLFNLTYVRRLSAMIRELTYLMMIYSMGR